MIVKARTIASPLGRTALAGILALAALSGLAFSQHGLPGRYGAPLMLASPAAITGELA